MRIDGVVDDRPEDVSGEEGGCRDAVGGTERLNPQRGASHWHGPREREAEDDLRVVRDALGERVEEPEQG